MEGEVGSRRTWSAVGVGGCGLQIGHLVRDMMFVVIVVKQTCVSVRGIQICQINPPLKRKPS